MVAKHLLLTGALLVSASYKTGKQLTWYASRRLAESDGTRVRPVKAL
jgi:hypothetical protein